MIAGNLDSIWPRIARAVARLGCETETERLSALHGVDRLLAGCGLDYLDMADRLTQGVHASPPSAAPWSPGPSCFGDLARAARDLDRGRLTPHERKFVVDMCARGFGFRPSPRQAGWLEAIVARLSGRAAA